MLFAWLAVRKDIARHLRDPVALLLWLLIPLLVGAAVSLATGGRGGGKPEARVLIVDEDGSLGSSLLRRTLSQAGGIIQTEDVQSLQEGQNLISGGKATALLVIPKGFGNALLRETPTRLRLVTNPEQSILPEIVHETLEVFTDAAFYLHRVLGREIRAIADRGSGGRTQSDEEMERVNLAISQATTRIQKYFFPPLMELEVTVPNKNKSDTLDLAVLFLPGILLMSLLFMAQGLSDDVWQERAQGTLRRIACGPRGTLPLLAGKVLAGVVIISAVVFLIVGLGMVYLSLPLARLPLALAWGTLSGAVFLILFILLQMYASSQRAGSILTNTIVFPLMMLGGSMFPSEIMPRWMAAIGAWTPNGWALERLKGILMGRTDAASLAAGFAVLLTAGLLGVTAGAWRMRRFATGV
jgi:ABC-2 type transport system permease protein